MRPRQVGVAYTVLPFGKDTFYSVKVEENVFSSIRQFSPFSLGTFENNQGR